MRKYLQLYRRQLTHYDSLLAYSLLGVVGGVASGLVVIAFEMAIRATAELWGVDGGEDFESLPLWLCFALPVIGALVLGAAFSLLKPEDREVGIVHVLSRMHSHYGVLPLKNALVPPLFSPVSPIILACSYNTPIDTINVILYLPVDAYGQYNFTVSPHL